MSNPETKAYAKLTGTLVVGLEIEVGFHGPYSGNPELHTLRGVITKLTEDLIYTEVTRKCQCSPACYYRGIEIGRPFSYWRSNNYTIRVI